MWKLKKLEGKKSFEPVVKKIRQNPLGISSVPKVNEASFGMCD